MNAHPALIHKIGLLSLLLALSVGVRLPGLFSRAIWYDESITLLQTAGNPHPDWPEEPTLAGSLKTLFEGTPTISRIVTDLRQTDVHPPLYYCLLSLWRRIFGFSLETARLFSLLFSVGSVLMLYLLLCQARFERPFVPSFIFALSSGSVFIGYEARSYAFALFFVNTATLFAYLASEVNPNDIRRLSLYSLMIAVCCGFAFQTNYLTLFPISAILAWVIYHIWKISKPVALLTPMVASSIGLIGLSFFIKQLGMRPNQAAGFTGIFSEMLKISQMNILVIWKSTEIALIVVFLLVLFALIGNAILYIANRWSELNRKFLSLVIVLAAIPSAGIFLLDVIFNKHLADFKYFIFACPALAVLLAYGTNRGRSGKFLLISLLSLQLAVINRGSEKHVGEPGSHLRSVAKSIRNAPSHSQIVAIAQGAGRGSPASALYELAPETTVIFFNNNSTLEKLQASIQEYEDVWLIPSSDRRTLAIENELFRRLQGSGRYRHHQSLGASAKHLSS